MDRSEAEIAVRKVFRLAYELAQEDIDHMAYDPETATAHCVDLAPCRSLIDELADRRARSEADGGEGS